MPPKPEARTPAPLPNASPHRWMRPFVSPCRTRSSAAADEITRELAPGSVELRIRGRNPEFVVSLPPAEPAADAPAEPSYGFTDTDEGGTSRINLRLPDQLKVRVEQAALSEGLSANTWLVRAASAALDRGQPGSRREGRVSPGAGRFTGWVR